MDVCVHACMCACMHVCMHVYMHVRVHMHVQMCAFHIVTVLSTGVDMYLIRYFNSSFNNSLDLDVHM